MAVDLSGWGPRLRTNDRIETDVMLAAVLVHAPSQDAFLLEANRLEETLARPIPLHHVGLDPVNAQVVEGIRTDGLNDLLSDAPAPLLTVQIEADRDVPVIAVPVMQSDGPDDAVLAFLDHAPSNRRAGGIVGPTFLRRVTASPTRASGLRAVKRATSGWASMSKSAGASATVSCLSEKRSVSNTGRHQGGRSLACEAACLLIGRSAPLF